MMQWRMRRYRQGMDATCLESDSASPPADQLYIRFWGVRGSHPAAYATSSRYGGNTTCMELRYGRHLVIVDAGTGIMALGEALEREWRHLPREQRPTLTLLFTHAHHDHLCGLPFFAPFFKEGLEIHLLGPDLAGLTFEEILAGYMRSPYFPIDFHELPSLRHVRSIADGAHIIWPEESGGPQIAREAPARSGGTLEARVHYAQLHPRDGTLTYRVSAGGRSLVFATDVEANDRSQESVQRFIRFAHGADVLVHDAQYSEDDYAGESPHRGFGHSTPAMAARIAQAAKVSQLVLFHHDPAYADADIMELEGDARRLFPDTIAAREGAEILLDAGAERHV